MNFSLYSFLMALLWSSAFILLLCYFRKDENFIKVFGAWPLLAIVVFTILRCFAPIEILSFTRVLQDEGMFARINRFFLSPLWEGGPSVQLLALLLWSTGSVLFFVALLKDCWTFRKNLKATKSIERQAITDSAERISAELGIQKYMLATSYAYLTPAVAGFLQPIVLLPGYLGMYSDEDFDYIFRHEFTHWKNHDLWIKLLIALLGCLFWWNPLVYLLKKDLDRTLEIKCDLSVTRNMDSEARSDYSLVLTKTIRFATHHQRRSSTFLVTELVKGDQGALEQRIEMILADPPEPRRQRLAVAITIVVMSILMVLSYAFIFQPGYYDSPDEDFGGEGIVESVPDNTYLVQTKDGNYELYVDGLYIQIVSPETASEMIAGGFPLKEGE